jgi:hypothetical protein
MTCALPTNLGSTSKYRAVVAFFVRLYSLWTCALSRVYDRIQCFGFSTLFHIQTIGSRRQGQCPSFWAQFSLFYRRKVSGLHGWFISCQFPIIEYLIMQAQLWKHGVFMECMENVLSCLFEAKRLRRYLQKQYSMQTGHFQSEPANG